MTSKKIVLISSAFIFTIFFTIFGCCIFFRQNNNKIPVAQECPKIKNLETKSAEENSETKPAEENLNAEPKEEWSTYYDERYKYRIDFPTGFSALSIYEHTLADGVPTTNGGIVFSPADSIDAPGGISVEIFENSKYKSLDEWLESEKSEYTSRVVEKKVNIDGNEAVVTHQAGMQDGKIFEEYKQPKMKGKG
ncbi:MAG: hypothetical protein ABIC82_04395 [bacterium]